MHDELASRTDVEVERAHRNCFVIPRHERITVSWVVSPSDSSEERLGSDEARSES